MDELDKRILELEVQLEEQRKLARIKELEEEIERIRSPWGRRTISIHDWSYSPYSTPPNYWASECTGVVVGKSNLVCEKNGTNN